MTDMPKPKKVCLVCKRNISNFKYLPKHIAEKHYLSVTQYLQMFQLSAEELGFTGDLEKVERKHTSPFPDATPSLDLAEYCRTQVEELKQKFQYEDSPILEETAYLMGISRQLKETYEKGLRIHGRHNPDLLKALRDNSKHITTNLNELNKQVLAAEEARKDPTTDSSLASLHRETLTDAEAYIKANIGEFSFSCLGCGAVVMTGGLPHWALVKDMEGNWAAWSTELAELVNDGEIRIHQMAYALRTSVEAILICAKQREFKFTHPVHKSAEEEKLRELMLKRLK